MPTRLFITLLMPTRLFITLLMPTRLFSTLLMPTRLFYYRLTSQSAVYSFCVEFGALSFMNGLLFLVVLRVLLSALGECFSLEHWLSISYEILALASKFGVLLC